MKKYISQQNNPNFVYPNNNLAEYDVDIIHNITTNTVTGTLNTVAFSGTTSSLTLTINATWDKNDAEPFITSGNTLELWSVHCMTPDQPYYKPWRMIGKRQSSVTDLTTYTSSITYNITPAQMGVSSFTNGTYNFEIRFIGGISVYPISFSGIISGLAVTPTPTPTQSSNFVPSPTPTPSVTSSPFPAGTHTPTPTPTGTPTSTPLTPIYSFKLGTGVTSTDACNNYNPSINNTYWSYDNALDNLSELYLNGTYPLSGTPPNNYYSDGTVVWYVTAGVLVGATMCTYTATPTPTPTQTNQSYGFYTGATYANSTLACAASVYPQIGLFLPLNVTTPTVGAYFYKDQYCTPGNTFVGNGNYYKVRQNSSAWALQVASSGQITAVTTC